MAHPQRRRFCDLHRAQPQITPAGQGKTLTEGNPLFWESAHIPFLLLRQDLGLKVSLRWRGWRRKKSANEISF